MYHLPRQIQTLRKKIELDQAELLRLEELQKDFLEQQKERQHYLSSKEIIEIMKTRSGQTKNMTAIKRWADAGKLGEKIEERERFPLLVHKQGNKRFLFPRTTVYQFLLKKNFIRPRFEVLDQVKWKHKEGTQANRGIIIQHQLNEDQFIYTIQLEGTGEMITDVEEHFLDFVEEEA